MKQRSVEMITEYLSKRPRARIVDLRPVGVDDYRLMSLEDRRDGRTHVSRTPHDLEAWLRSFAAEECLQPAVGLCGRCGDTRNDHDIDGEYSAIVWVQRGRRHNRVGSCPNDRRA